MTDKPKKKYNYTKKTGRPKEYTDEVISKEAKELLQYVENTELPLIQEFTYNKKYNRAKLSELSNNNIEFRNALDKLKEKQHNTLVSRSLAGDYNPTIAMLLLKNNHGYKDKQDVEHSGHVEGTKINVLAIKVDGNQLQHNPETDRSVKISYQP